MPETPGGPAPPPPRRPPPGRGPQQPRPPVGPSRADRRAAAANRSRPMQIIAAVSVVALVLAAAFFFFFRGSDDAEERKRVTKAKIADVVLTVGAVYNANAGPPVQLPPEIQNAVMATLATYVDGGLLAPIREGAAAEDIAAIFDAGAGARLGGPDRAVLFEEGLPRVTTSFETATQPVILTALSDGGGNFVLVTANLLYQAKAKTKAGDITSSRFSELTLINDGGAWKITGYDIALVREGPGAETTTTTAAA